MQAYILNARGTVNRNGNKMVSVTLEVHPDGGQIHRGYAYLSLNGGAKEVTRSILERHGLSRELMSTPVRIEANVTPVIKDGQHKPVTVEGKLIGYEYELANSFPKGDKAVEDEVWA